LADTLTIVPDYFHPEIIAPHHAFPDSGYNAFIGPVPWLLAGFVAVVSATLVARRRRSPSRFDGPTPGAFATVLGAALVVTGFSLALGAKHPASPSAILASLPVLGSARAFVRFEVVLVFGLAILTAQAFPYLARSLGDPRWARALRGSLAAACILPVAFQSALLVWNLPAEPHEEILGHYRIQPEASPQVPPRLLTPLIYRTDRSGHLTAILGAGYWPSTCRSDLTLPRRGLRLRQRTEVPLSTPPPSRARIAGPNHLVLEYPQDLAATVQLGLRVLDTTELDVPHQQDPETRVVSFRSEDLANGRLTITGRYAGPVAGARISSGGLGGSLLLLGWVWREERRASRA
jgi:hypothetical protein